MIDVFRKIYREVKREARGLTKLECFKQNSDFKSVHEIIKQGVLKIIKLHHLIYVQHPLIKLSACLNSYDLSLKFSNSSRIHLSDKLYDPPCLHQA